MLLLPPGQAPCSEDPGVSAPCLSFLVGTPSPIRRDLPIVLTVVFFVFFLRVSVFGFGWTKRLFVQEVQGYSTCILMIMYFEARYYIPFLALQPKPNITT